jgi:hypothetical protein
MNRVCPWNKSFHTKFQTEPVPENDRTTPQLPVQAKMANDPEHADETLTAFLELESVIRRTTNLLATSEI